MPVARAVDIVPNEASVTRIADAILFERSEEWAIPRARFIILTSITSVRDDPLVSLPTLAGGSDRPYQ